MKYGADLERVETATAGNGASGVSWPNPENAIAFIRWDAIPFEDNDPIILINFKVLSVGVLSALITNYHCLCINRDDKR